MVNLSFTSTVVYLVKLYIHHLTAHLLLEKYVTKIEVVYLYK